MNNASLNQIVNKLLAFGHGHKYIKTVAHGQLDEMDLTSRITYPLMHIVPQDITPSGGRLQFSFDVVFADMPRLKSDKPENVLEIQSDMEQIARDLYTEIKNGGVLFGDMTEVGDDWSALPFQDEYHNYLSGVTLSINIIVASNWNACEIPADWVNGTSADIPQFGRDLTIAVYEDGVFRVNAREVNFIGDGVNVGADGNRANVTVTGGGGGLTCEDLPECQTIIDIEENIDTVEESVATLNTAVEGLSTEVSTLTTEVTGINNSVIEINEELDVVGNNLATLTTEVAGKLDSVTGNIVDNTDPLNPVVNQVQADWNENDSNAASFIQNKPTIPDVPITIEVVLSGASVTTTSNSLVDITGLTVALPANTSWLIESRLGVACNGTGGVRFGYSAPADSSGNMYVEGVATSMAIYQQSLSVNGALSATAVQRFNGSSRANITGRIDMGATAGNFTLRFASGTSGQLSTIGTGTGSYLKLTRI